MQTDSQHRQIPPHVVEFVIDHMAPVDEDSVILMPFAGRGELVERVVDSHWFTDTTRLDVVESDGDNVASLLRHDDGVFRFVVQDDFVRWSDRYFDLYTHIIADIPPTTESQCGGASAIAAILNVLRPGGHALLVCQYDTLRKKDGATKRLVKRLAEQDFVISEYLFDSGESDMVLTVLKRAKTPMPSHASFAVEPPTNAFATMHDLPLQATVQNGIVCLMIGVNRLQEAFNGPQVQRSCRVTNAEGFAQDVVKTIMRQEHDGTTAADEFLDNAMINTVAFGSAHMRMT